MEITAVNQQSIDTKISVLIENLNELLERTLNRSHIHTMNEKLNFIKMTQTQYHSLVFEQELFDILCKNKYAIKNTENLVYNNTEYPFNMIICSQDSLRSSIFVNNVGMVLVKFILYLRMLNQNVARADSPNCFLAVNMKKIPFGRVCIDIDYQLPMMGEEDEDDDRPSTSSMANGGDNEDYEKFVEKCFMILCELTTAGNVIMTSNCFTPNTRSFHLITEQQFDETTRNIILTEASERIKQLNRRVKIDKVDVWMLPFGRGHIPVRKYNRKTNAFQMLEYPYTEIDFELAMPFDLSQGTDNFHTLYTMCASEHDTEDIGQYDILCEYDGSEIVHRYRIAGVDNIAQNLQLCVKVISSKYDFKFQSHLNAEPYERNYIPCVFGNKYNNFFICVSNKKLLFENNWQIPKQKPKQRPTEPYEIYRFIEHKFLNGIETVEDLFKKMPVSLVQRNVTIGNVDELQNEELKNKMTSRLTKVQKKFSDSLKEFSNTNAQNIDMDYEREITTEPGHPWPYYVNASSEIMETASMEMINLYEYYRKTLPKNVYPYEKCPDVMDYFCNIQSMLAADNLAGRMRTICNIILGDRQHTQNYMFPLYEFFCRLHYIDACVTESEYRYLVNNRLSGILGLALSDTELAELRKMVEMTPDTKAYRKFPTPNTPMAEIWNDLDAEHKILLHIMYMMIVEHNYTSLFFYLHNVLNMDDVTQVICSFLLNILDDSYMEAGNNDEMVQSYSSREFLNFVYMTFINGGTNYECDFRNENIYFNMINLRAYISDMQVMFIASPIWFFLCSYQYVNESMDFVSRFNMFVDIFAQPNIQSAHDDHQSGGGGGGPPSKMARTEKNPLNYEQCFKKNGIKEPHQNDLLTIFYRYIMCFCHTESGAYIYDGPRFVSTSFKYKNKALTVADPVKYASIYRYQYGIYNAWTMQQERNTSVLYTHISISNDEFSKFTYVFNPYNDDIYRILVNRFLKSITFTRILNYQKNLALLLAPIYDPNVESTVKILNYNIDSIQINIHDLASSDFLLPESMLADILRTRNKFYEMFKWLYCIICHYSESYSCVITTPSSFIPRCMVQDIDGRQEGAENGSLESTYSMFQQQMTENSYSMDENRGERLMQRIHKILEAKKREQRENITDELQKLSQRELTSSITLFDNIYLDEDEDDDDADANANGGDVPIEIEENSLQSNASTSSNTSSATTASDAAAAINGEVAKKNNRRNRRKHNDETITTAETISKCNLSIRGTMNTDVNMLDFFASDEFMENSKIKLLAGLFNRKLNLELSQMSMESFQKIIEDNHSHHITKFVLMILSWFIRTLHTHVFTETHFFREIQKYRQLLYDEMSDMVFKHNGYFMYNNKITNISDIFSCYSRNVSLSIDPVFEMSLPIDEDLYLDYNVELENRVSRDIIKDIEDGCVSAIYQGQFIEDTNVDLNRLWARVTVPRNKHRISPLFSLHTATGKSEYLTERCKRHFYNKYHNNFLDPTSLKSGDHRGTDMARELNANLIVCIEEFSNLSEKFKQVCGHSAITYKPLYADSKACFQNNSTVILSTNSDPKCTEEAVIARLHVYPRRIQYANVNKYAKFQRSSMCASTSLLKTNNIMAVQLIMEKMPRVQAENRRGNFMMTWLLKRFFLYNINDPVTIQTSETLQNHNNNFHNMINAQELVLERLELNTTSSMTLFQFRRLVTRICEENRNLFNTKVDTYNIFTILSDKLKTMIDNETQTIRVCEKNTR